MSTLAYELVGNCFVLVIGKEAPSDPEWDEYLAYVRSHRDPAVAPVTLVASHGGGPTSSQRARLNELTKTSGTDKTLRVAVLTESATARGITIALSWFAKGYRAFAPTDTGKALEHLGVTEPTAAKVMSTLARLEQRAN